MTPSNQQTKNWRPGTEKFLSNPYFSEHNPDILNVAMAAEDPQTGQHILVSCEISAESLAKVLLESNDATVKVVGAIPFEITESKQTKPYLRRAA